LEQDKLADSIVDLQDDNVAGQGSLDRMVCVLGDPHTVIKSKYVRPVDTVTD